MIDYLVGEIGQKLSVRTAPEKGYIRRTTIRVPMDLEDFDDDSVVWVVVGEGLM